MCTLLLAPFFSSVLLYKRTVFENPQKVSFNIASEASYVYILRGQKLIKNAKKCFICRKSASLSTSVKGEDVKKFKASNKVHMGS